ncbi:MAG: hypothetical protein KDA48_17310 [Amphiplicatus sp.]|nr:hypothetical protein [Amphiplicatus sp.]
MKIEVEFRTDMSRPETFRALRIVAEASERLAHRMTDAELERLAQAGAELIGFARAETTRRSAQYLECSAGRQTGGKQATPPAPLGLYGGVAPRLKQQAENGRHARPGGHDVA